MKLRIRSLPLVTVFTALLLGSPAAPVPIAHAQPTPQCEPCKAGKRADCQVSCRSKGSAACVKECVRSQCAEVCQPKKKRRNEPAPVADGASGKPATKRGERKGAKSRGVQ